MARVANRTGGRDATTGVIPGRYALSVGRPDRDPPPGWRWTPLTDVARLETGHTPSRKHPEYWGGDVPWLGIRDATSAHGFSLYDTAEHTNELGIANSSARILPTNTVCLSRTASIGYVVVMGRPMATSQDFVNWVCSDELDFRFLKYVLLAEGDSFHMFASGSVHQTIYFPEVKALHVCLPPIGEQRRIADILSSVDDKIVLNGRVNRTIDASVRALFESWFVDFDPVHGNAVAVDCDLPSQFSEIFPDRLVQRGCGEVPEGWSTISVHDIATYINGAAYRTFEPNSDRRGLPIVKIGELKAGVTAQTRFSDVDMPEKYRIRPREILFAWSGNPDTSIDTFVWSNGEAWLNQHIFRVLPHRARERSFVLALLRNLRPVFAEIARDKQTTGLGHVTAADMKRIHVVLPDDRVLLAWDEVAGPLYEEAFLHEQESRLLANLRDALSPRLLSGEIRVTSTNTLLGVK